MALGLKRFDAPLLRCPGMAKQKVGNPIDDTYLIMSDLNLTSLQNQVNIQLKNIDFWLRNNKLSLNFSKSTFLLIHKQSSRTIETRKYF